jgi:serine/threonine protein kinase
MSALEISPDAGGANALGAPDLGQSDGAMVAVSLCHAAGPTAGTTYTLDVALPLEFVAAVDALLQLPAAAGACDHEAGVDLYALVAEEGAEGEAALQRLGDDNAVTAFIVAHAHAAGSLVLYFTCTDDVSTPLPDQGAPVEAGSEGAWTGLTGLDAHQPPPHDTDEAADDSPTGGTPVMGTPSASTGHAASGAHPPPLPRMDVVAGRQERRLQYQRGPVLMDAGAMQLQLCVSMLTAQLLMMRSVVRQEGESEASWLGRVAAVEREYKLLRTLRHPGIIRCLARDNKRPDQFGILLEYLPGGTLRQLVLRFGPLPESCTRRFVRQVAIALADSHERGMVHGAVSADHVLLTGDGAAKLAGWTDAFACDGRAASPSPAWHGSAAARKADAWQLGLLAYELVTGVVCDWSRVMPCLDHWAWVLHTAAERNAAVAEGVGGTRPAPPLALPNVSGGDRGAGVAAGATGARHPSHGHPAASPVLHRGFTAGELAAYVPASSPTRADAPPGGSPHAHVPSTSRPTDEDAVVAVAAGGGEPHEPRRLSPPSHVAPPVPPTVAPRHWWSAFASWRWDRPKAGDAGGVHAPTSSSSSSSPATGSMGAPGLTRTGSPTKRAASAMADAAAAVAASVSLPSSSASSGAAIPPPPHPHAVVAASPPHGDWGPSDAEMRDANPAIRRLKPSPDHSFPPARMLAPGFVDTVTHSGLPRLLDDLAACLPALPPLPVDASPQLRAFVGDCTRLHASERPSVADLLQHHPFLQPDDLDAAVSASLGSTDGASLCGFDGLRRILAAAAAASRAADSDSVGDSDPAAAPPLDMSADGGVTSLGGPQFRMVASPAAVTAQRASSSGSVAGEDARAGARMPVGHHGRVGTSPRGRYHSGTGPGGGAGGGADDSTDFTVASDALLASHLLTTSGGALARTHAAGDGTTSSSGLLAPRTAPMRLTSQASMTSEGSGGSGSGGLPLSISSPALRAKVGSTGEVITLPRGLGYEQLMARPHKGGVPATRAATAGYLASGRTVATAGGGTGLGFMTSSNGEAGSWLRTSGVARSLRGSPAEESIRVGGGVGLSTLSPSAGDTSADERPRFFPAPSLGSDVGVVGGAPGSGATPASTGGPGRGMWRGATLRQSSVMSMGPEATVEPPSMALVDGGVVHDAYRMHDPLLQANALVGDKEAQKRKAQRDALGRDAAGRTLQQTLFMAAAAAGIVGGGSGGGGGGGGGGVSFVAPSAAVGVPSAHVVLRPHAAPTLVHGVASHDPGAGTNRSPLQPSKAALPSGGAGAAAVLASATANDRPPAAVHR